jgi:tRNA threonylcarbamoyl adenosine modification protein YjeE
MRIEGILHKDKLLKNLKKLIKIKPGLYLLKGDLGTGKTTLVKAITRDILSDDYHKMSSPTYNLVNTYKNNETTIHHLDLYRLKSKSELQEIPLIEMISDPNNYTFIEWPELLNPNSINFTLIELKHIDETRRGITITDHINHE